MNRIKKLLNRLDDIVDNINADELIKRIEIDEKEQQQYAIQFEEIKVYYNNNSEYITKNKIKYNNYKEYNDYDVEESVWTSIKAS